jgi:hypothetical protein
VDFVRGDPTDDRYQFSHIDRLAPPFDRSERARELRDEPAYDLPESVPIVTVVRKALAIAKRALHQQSDAGQYLGAAGERVVPIAFSLTSPACNTRGQRVEIWRAFEWLAASIRLMERGVSLACRIRGQVKT